MLQGKVTARRRVKKYNNEVFIDGGSNHKHDTGWDVADEYGCGVKIDVELDGEKYSFPHYSCILGECKECDEVAYKAPELEIKRTDDTIRYTRFTTHARCSFHGSESIENFVSKPFTQCDACKDLSVEEKKNQNVKI